MTSRVYPCGLGSQHERRNPSRSPHATCRLSSISRPHSGSRVGPACCEAPSPVQTSASRLQLVRRHGPPFAHQTVASRQICNSKPGRPCRHHQPQRWPVLTKLLSCCPCSQGSSIATTPSVYAVPAIGPRLSWLPDRDAAAPPIIAPSRPSKASKLSFWPSSNPTTCAIHVDNTSTVRQPGLAARRRSDPRGLRAMAPGPCLHVQ